MQKSATPKEHRITLKQWKNIIKAQSNKCAMCGCEFNNETKPTIDHIVPLSRGGEHSSVNVQALCMSCNASKQSKLDYEKIQTYIFMDDINKFSNKKSK